MAKITARVSDQLLEALDAVSVRLNRSRSSVIRLALEGYLKDSGEVAVAPERICDPSDPVLDWEDVKRELQGSLQRRFALVPVGAERL